VDLVEHDGLARQAEKPDEEVLGLQHGQERLIDRSDTERRQ
jgi:hypothetical protein